MIDPQEKEELDALAMESVADRLNKVIDDRRLSMRDWGLRSGLSHGALKNLIDRFEADPRHECVVWTLVDLAEAEDLSLDWLILGRGHETAHHNAEADLYPSRADAITLARRTGTPVEILEAVMAETPEDDPGTDYWLRRIRQLRLAMSSPALPAPTVHRNKKRPIGKK